jgi:hypothetical protein
MPLKLLEHRRGRLIGRSESRGKHFCQTATRDERVVVPDQFFLALMFGNVSHGYSVALEPLTWPR